MKHHLIFFAALFVFLQPPRALGQQITVQAADAKQTILTKAEIDALPHVKVRASAHGETAAFKGVLLRSVLEKGRVALQSSRCKRIEVRIHGWGSTGKGDR